MRRRGHGGDTLPALVQAGQGLAILGMWAGYVRGGAFKDGARTVENNMFLGLHVVAETVMGVLLVIGSAGLLLRRAWGRAVGLLGLGAVIYSTLNGLADTLRNKPALTPVLLVNCLLASVTAGVLASRGPLRSRESTP
jgi:hypothetical protein